MKFLALKSALESYEEKSIDKGNYTAASRIQEKGPAPLKRVVFGPIEKIVGGVIRWKPVDRTAAIVTSKAPWWAIPIYSNSNPQPERTVTNKPNKRRKQNMNINDHSGQEFITHGEPGMLKPKAFRGGEPLFDKDDVVRCVIAEINKQPQELTQLARACIDARKAVDENMIGLGGMMEDFRAKAKTHLDEIRQTRFAIVQEFAQITGPLKEVRQFFHGSDHLKQLEQLREFVSVCERLQKLKSDGFLDAIAETMVRLA